VKEAATMGGHHWQQPVAACEWPSRLQRWFGGGRSR